MSSIILTTARTTHLPLSFSLSLPLSLVPARIRHRRRRRSRKGKTKMEEEEKRLLGVLQFLNKSNNAKICFNFFF